MDKNLDVQMEKVLREMKEGSYDGLAEGLDFFNTSFLPVLKVNPAFSVFLPDWKDALILGIKPAAAMSGTLHFCLLRALIVSFPPNDCVDTVMEFLKTYPDQRIMVQQVIEQTALRDDETIQQLLTALSNKEKGS